MGLLAAVSYAVKQYVAPKVSQWYHEWRHDADKEKAEEEQQKTAQLVANAIQSQVNLAPTSVSPALPKVERTMHLQLLMSEANCLFGKRAPVKVVQAKELHLSPNL